MKKIYTLLTALTTLFSAPAFAQETAPEGESVPNRILVTNNAGTYTGFKIDYIDQVNFARVDGEVLANVEILNVDTEELRLKVTKTPDCNYYKLAVIPRVTADRFTNDEGCIHYINTLPSTMVATLWDDFTDGALTGIELNSESDYSLITVGVDRYGVEAGVVRVDFSTPAPVIEGDPHVASEIVSVDRYSFKIKFTPNDDVTAYYLCAGEKGTMQQQYEMFAPMMGFSNFSQMIKMWGIERYEENEVEWNQMLPGTEYEVFIAMTDINGNFAPYEVCEVTTLGFGGPGEASVAIEIGDYFMSEWDGDMLPTQTISYIPNDQANGYRMEVYRASYYAENAEDCKAELCSDPWMPTSGWFQYEPASFDYPIMPGTALTIIAAAKNGEGVWGPVTELNYTTPDTLEGYDPEAAPARPSVRKGYAPKNMKAASLPKGVLPKFEAPAKSALELRAN